LDDGKIYRKALYFMVKTMGFPVKIFPRKPIQWPCPSMIFQRGLGPNTWTLVSHRSVWAPLELTTGYRAFWGDNFYGLV
jgi:hypothetical protein